MLTNAGAFAENISNRCDGSHEHQRVQGRETAKTAIYPNDFATAVMRAFHAWRNQAKVGIWDETDWKQPSPTSLNFPTTTASSSSTLNRPREAETNVPLPIHQLQGQGKSHRGWTIEVSSPESRASFHEGTCQLFEDWRDP